MKPVEDLKFCLDKYLTQDGSARKHPSPMAAHFGSVKNIFKGMEYLYFSILLKYFIKKSVFKANAVHYIS